MSAENIRVVTTTGVDGKPCLGVLFPFALKDNFKLAFPNARWNRDARRWEVGPRSKKALEQWIGIVSPSAQALADVEAADLNETEIAKIRAEAEALVEGAGGLEQIAARLAQTAEALAAARATLDAARARKAAAEDAMAQRQREIDAALNAAIDVSSVIAAEQKMSRAWARGHSGKADWLEAERVALRAQKALAEAGITWSFVENLCSRNFNRPDRDNRMPASARYDVRIESPASAESA